jgi:O-antigen ligase
MTLRIDGALYRKFCVVAAVGIFFSNFANFSEKWGLIPLYWIFALCALTGPLLASAAMTQRIPVRPLMIWCGGFLAMSMLWYFPSAQDARAYQEVQTRILSVTFILVFLFLVARPEEQKLAKIAVALTTLVSVGLNIYEVFEPMTFSKIPGRSSGLFENSNQSGAGIMLGMILAYGIIPSRLRVPFVVICGLGIVTTFTRSAMLGWIVVTLFWMAQSGINLRKVRTMVLVAALGFGFVASPFWGDLQQSLETSGVLDMENLQRLSFFSSGTTADASAAQRKAVVEAGIAMFKERPLTGYGTGRFRYIPGFDQTVHNIYVAMMIDHGILGLFVLPSFLLAAVYRANAKTLELTGPLVLFILLWGMFSHNVMEERYILLSVALTGAIVTSSQFARAEKHDFARQVLHQTESMEAMAHA